MPVYSSLNSEKLALVLWMFDTGDTGCMDLKDTRGCVEKDAINWFLAKDKELRAIYGNTYISLAFAHIPPPEF